MPFYLIPDRADLIGEYNTLITCIDAQMAHGTSPVVVVLDTLNQTLAGAESKDEDMTAYVAAATAIRARSNCLVIIVHHCGVNSTRPRGHTSLTGACDAQLAVKRDASGLITMRVEYMKDGDEGAEVHNRLARVEIGSDDEAGPLTSCVVVPADDEVPVPERGRLRGAAKVALELLRKAIDNAGEEPPACNHIPTSAKCVSTDVWRRYCYEGQVAGSAGAAAKRKAFNRATAHLQEIGAVGCWDGLVWIV